MTTLRQLTKPIYPQKESPDSNIDLSVNTDINEEALKDIKNYIEELTGKSLDGIPNSNISTLSNENSGPQFSTPDDSFATQNEERYMENSTFSDAADRISKSDFNKFNYDIDNNDNIKRFTNNVLQNNRFSGIDQQFEAQGENFGVTTNLSRTLLIDQELGKFVALPDDSNKNIKYPGGEINNKPNGSQSNSSREILLENIGLSLLVQATGRTELGDKLLKDSSNSSLNRAAARVLLPNPAQYGITRINGNKLNPTGKNSYGYAGQFKDAGSSYGVLNSPLQSFTNRPSYILTVVAAGAVLLGIGAGLAAILRFENNKKTVEADVRSGDLEFGERSLEKFSSNSSAGSNISPAGRIALSTTADLFGITDLKSNWIQTTHASDDCILEGLTTFLLNPNNAQNPAYILGILKIILSDSRQVIETVQSIGSPGSFLNAASNISESIFNSRLFTFFRAMVALGEASLCQKDSSGLPTPDRYELSSNNFQMLGILPRSYSSSAMIAKLFGFNGPTVAIANLQNPNGKAHSLGDNAEFLEKIDIAKVRELESSLNAQAFPLTFHDLRTNEFMQFAAFVSQISDGFDASYSSTQAFGRGDEIMTYQGTKRSINLDFTIIATNPKDHDLMWAKINKLVTMIYPQYSKGRLVKKRNGDSSNSFRMPFSQIMTASPMIRIRFGETITNNYSKFALSRLFGTGEAAGGSGENTAKTFSLDDLNLDSTGNNDDGYDIQKEILNEASKIINKKYLYGFASGDVVFNKREVFITKKPIVDPGLTRQESRQNLREIREAVVESGNSLKQNIKSKISANRKLIVKRKIETLGKTLYYVSPDVLTADENYEYEFLIDANSLTLDANSFINGLINNQNINQENYNQLTAAVQRFFDEENNPFVKSFNNSMSQGLAGFITSLKFDYGDAPYETAPGSRAPIFVKISISFSPIHDIAPGIDADGMNRAPVYKVGHINRLAAGADANPANDYSLDQS